MHLVLPAGALLQIGDALHGDVGAELMLQLQPGGVPLIGAHVGIFIHNVLESVHHGAVGDEGEGVQRVHVAVLGRVRAEELVHMGPGKELHAHGVGLRRLHAAAAQLQGEAVIGDQVGVQGVARLVGHHVHIAGGAVEVCQDERLLVFGKFGAVAAAPLVLAGVHVKGIVFQHHVDECAGLLAHAVVHLFGRGEDVFLAAYGAGIPAGDDHVVVIELVIRNAQALCVLRAESCHHGHHVTQYVLPEGLYAVLIVAETAHAVVAQLDKVPVAHLFGHAVPDMDHAVVDIVQLGLVLLQTPAKDLIALPAGGSVVALAVLHQHGPGQLFAAEFKLHAGHQLGILTDQTVFLHHVGHDIPGHGLALDLHALKQHRGQGLFQLRTEGGVQQRGGVVHGVVVYGGANLVVVVVLSHVKLVGGVDGVAHIGKRVGSVVFAVELEIIFSGFQNFLRAFGVFDAGNNILHYGGNLFKRYPLVGQFGNFHMLQRPFRLVNLFYTISLIFSIGIFKGRKLWYTENTFI